MSLRSKIGIKALTIIMRFGSQGKAVLAIKGAKVPPVEGNRDAKQRRTANLTTFSNVERIEKGEIPYSELMFKAAADGQVTARLKKYLRSRGLPKWLSVTTAPKGSYREADIIAWLDAHLEKCGPRVVAGALSWQMISQRTRPGM